MNQYFIPGRVVVILPFYGQNVGIALDGPPIEGMSR